MARYSPERKEAILKKMAPPYNMTVAELASQEGISTATLYNWRLVNTQIFKGVSHALGT